MSSKVMGKRTISECRYEFSMKFRDNRNLAKEKGIDGPLHAHLGYLMCNALFFE